MNGLALLGWLATLATTTTTDAFSWLQMNRAWCFSTAAARRHLSTRFQHAPVSRALTRPSVQKQDTKTQRAMSSSSSPPGIPQAAVSVVVRYQNPHTNTTTTTTSAAAAAQYLLIQRGKEPSKGMWSLAGGRIEWGETAWEGAQRELREETTGWPDTTRSDSTTTTTPSCLQWHPYPFTSSDGIGSGYHYVISQFFAQVLVGVDPQEQEQQPPALQPADDAAAVGWFTLDHIRSHSHNITTGVVRVIERAETLYQQGLLSSEERATK